MYGDKLCISCYGEKRIFSKLKNFFKEDYYELSDVKLNERINTLTVNLKYTFYNNPISEYFKNEESLLSERALIYIYFLYINDLEIYKNEKKNMLKRWTEVLNDENEEFLIVYVYNLVDNINEIKNIKKIIEKIKADFSHNSYKSNKILSFPLHEHENYDSNKKVKELYEQFKLRYSDQLKICIEKKYSIIKNGYNKCLTNFFSCVDLKKKTCIEKKKKKFNISDTYVNNEDAQINEFIEFYKKHNVFLFCNEFIDIKFFLDKNKLSFYINSLEFITDYDEKLYIDMYDNFLSLFIWNENLCLLYTKLKMFKKSYILYNTIAKLFIKNLNVYIKKKECIIHSSILFEKNYLTIGKYIREKKICSIHLLEYIFFKKFTILLFLNKFSYISSKALKFSQFFYTNKIFIFMHNFDQFENNLNKNSKDINCLKNIKKKLIKYKKKRQKKKGKNLNFSSDENIDEQKYNLKNSKDEKDIEYKKLDKYKKMVINELNDTFNKNNKNLVSKICIEQKEKKKNVVKEDIKEEENSINDINRTINNDMNSFKNNNDKLKFILNCCFINKESYFSIYFYNLANLIKFLFEHRSYFYQEDDKKSISDKNIKKNMNISRYLLLQKNIIKLGYKNNFTKKKKLKKNLKIKTKKSNSINDSSSQFSSLSEFSDSTYSSIHFLNNDFYINVSNIFKLSFVILKNILNTYNEYLSKDETNVKKIFFFNFYLNYLEEKRFEKKIEKADLEEHKNTKKNVYYNFPIYRIKNFSKDNEKKKTLLLMNIMNKIINLCYRKYNNISVINKFFLAILLFENKIYKKSFKLTKKIIQKSNLDILTFLGMQLILYHCVNNKFYHFCCSFFLSNKYIKILPFKNVNMNFTHFQNYQYYLFSLNNEHSILKLEKEKKYDNDFFSSLKKDISTFELAKKQVINIIEQNKIGSQILDIKRKEIHQREIKEVKSEEEKKNNSKNFNTEINEKMIIPPKINLNKLIKFETKQFCKDNYIFEINQNFLKGLKKFNFSVSKNEKHNDIYIPKSDIKICVQSNYNLYIFVSNMIFGYINKNKKSCHHFDENQDKKGRNNYDEFINTSNNLNIHHIETLLHLKIREYIHKKKKKIKESRIKNLCMEYDENLDLFIFSSFTLDYYINEIIIQLYNEKDNKILYLTFSKDKYIIKSGLNIIRLNITNILESNKIIWKSFDFKIDYVFLIINNFSFYQKIGVLPNNNLLIPFLNSYSNFIVNNDILIDTKKYTKFFLNQLLSPFYIRIKTLDSILDCKIITSYLNSSSLIYNNTNYIKLIIKNNEKNINYENSIIDDENGLLSTETFIKKENNDIKNIKIFVKNKNEISDYTCENLNISNSIVFYIEKNEDIQIDNLEVLDEVNFNNEDNNSLHLKNDNNNNKKYYNEEKNENLGKSYAIISFIPKKVINNNNNNINSEKCNNNNNINSEKFNNNNNINSEKFNNNNNLNNEDVIINNMDYHNITNNNNYSNTIDKLNMKCILNINLLEKKRKERKSDIHKLSYVNYIGKIKFVDFINSEDKLLDPYLNRQVVIEKTFDLVNIFKEKINTYRLNNTILYELILKLHNDNYSIYLKKFNISILKKSITQIKNVNIFFLNNENVKEKKMKCVMNEKSTDNLNDSNENNEYKTNNIYMNDSNEDNSYKSNELCKNKQNSISNNNSNFEENYFYDEIYVNNYIMGGMSIFLLFEVLYHNVINIKNNSNKYMNYESIIGDISIKYEYVNQFILKTLKNKKNEYIYKFSVLIPQFLLPINIHYNIPKCGMLHSIMNIKIIISNYINEDICMKYDVCIDNAEKRNNENEYSWLINGFRKKVLFIPKNSSYIINLKIIPLKIGLINFPPINYYIKLNNKWIEITKILKKSENFQIIISPSLHFVPKIWELI
ncbi:conserved Plasmodium protein, unknown function [Plasmodium gallinaceum]|uniref:Uncharacterized protein n=1 Tax=Plasmodium gallinaceum TaxID=5849 RepID=A0A1J1GYS0_PLAGA|nr:conserved Plasmodium protein, unknown function [Plasmodium gallinaceum]CRG96448.1 conserved Plasmodium protein, unknown function [Plasmodium gallinaceum]